MVIIEFIGIRTHKHHKYICTKDEAKFLKSLYKLDTSDMFKVKEKARIK